MSSLKRKSSEEVDDLLQVDNSNRLNSRWNNDELQLAIKGVRKYGKDFQAIAELLGTKTEAQVRSFFVNYRRKYNLDEKLQEFEQNNKAKEQDDDEEGKELSKFNDAANSSKQSDDDILEVSEKLEDILFLSTFILIIDTNS